MGLAAFLTALVVIVPSVLSVALPTPDKAGVNSTSSQSVKTLFDRSVDVNCRYVNATDIWAIGDGFQTSMDNLARSRSREQFTREGVEQAQGNYWAYNWVIVHTGHTTQFVNSRQWHVDRPTGWFGVSHGYQIYGFESGTFVLTVDGGPKNWAYNNESLSIVSDEIDWEAKTHTVVFSQPQLLPLCAN